MSDTAVIAEILDLDPDSEVDLDGLADECFATGLDLANPNHYGELADLAACHGYRS